MRGDYGVSPQLQPHGVHVASDSSVSVCQTEVWVEEKTPPVAVVLAVGGLAVAGSAAVSTGFAEHNSSAVVRPFGGFPAVDIAAAVAVGLWPSAGGSSGPGSASAGPTAPLWQPTQLDLYTHNTDTYVVHVIMYH